MSNENKTDNRKVVIGFGSKLFEVMLWVLLILPGIIFTHKKKRAKKFLNELNQQIEEYYSAINNLLNERLDILKNIYYLINKEVSFAKLSFSEISFNSDFTKKGKFVETATSNINTLVSETPKLNANTKLFDEIERNSNLQREIFSIKNLYNNKVLQWNKEIFLWPTKKIVSARENYAIKETFDVFPQIKTNGIGKLIDSMII